MCNALERPTASTGETQVVNTAVSTQRDNVLVLVLFMSRMISTDLFEDNAFVALQESNWGNLPADYSFFEREEDRIYRSQYLKVKVRDLYIRLLGHREFWF